MLYTVLYVKKSDIESNSKFDPAKIVRHTLHASDAVRAINSVKSKLVEDGDIESKGDIKILEAKLGA